MTEPVPDYIIQVICDDPGHARNKVAKIATFGRFTENGEIRWLIWDTERARWRNTMPDSNDVFRRYGAPDEDKGSTYRWQCKLCGTPLKVQEGTLHHVLEGTYRELPKTTTGKRVSQVPMSVLRQVASKPDRMQ